MFIGDAEFVYELLSPRFVFDVGFHFEIELGVKGGTVHVEVTAGMVWREIPLGMLIWSTRVEGQVRMPWCAFRA